MGSSAMKSHALARGSSSNTSLDKEEPRRTHRLRRRAAVSPVRGAAASSAPQLKPAYGGSPRCTTSRAASTKDAVDNTRPPSCGNKARIPNPRVEGLLDEKLIQLPNGVKVSPGDITAMMGDFYGAL